MSCEESTRKMGARKMPGNERIILAEVENVTFLGVYIHLPKCSDR